MGFGQKSSRERARAAFDLLRARIESEVTRPAVIAVASCTTGDGQDIAARGLAYSLAAASYSTLLVDTSLASTSLTSPASGLDIEEIGRRQTIPDVVGELASLTLNDATLQRTTSQRALQSGLEILRSKFDYVVVTTEHGASTAFAKTLIHSADAAIACVKTGRRQTSDDRKLSDVLDRLGTRYLGIIALDPSIMEEDAVPVTSTHGVVVPPRRAEPAQPDTERQRREMAKSPN